MILKEFNILPVNLKILDLALVKLPNLYKIRFKVIIFLLKLILTKRSLKKDNLMSKYFNMGKKKDKKFNNKLSCQNNLKPD